jgi:anti-sigma regulatory factor (Ser/Thr protein kinase)
MGETVRLRLPYSALSPGRARREVGSYLESIGYVDRVDEIQLVLSELVTNAVQHAHSDVEISLAVDLGGITLEVSDHGVEPLGTYGLSGVPDRGHGLGIVQSLADTWGVRRYEQGTTVWYRMSRSADGQRFTP